jgi:hypothetical protein
MQQFSMRQSKPKFGIAKALSTFRDIERYSPRRVA